MKILVYGPKARYDAYMPDFAAQLGAELVFCTLDQSPRQAAAENPDAQVLFDDPIVDVGREIIDLLPNLKLIQSEGVAFNRIDLEAAKEKGIFVCNNKGCNADSVAEHTIMLMLMALRHGITGHNAVKAGRQVQMKEAVMASGSPELGEQTVGLVGFGDIAQATPGGSSRLAARCTITVSIAVPLRWRPTLGWSIGPWRSWPPLVIFSPSTVRSTTRPGTW